MDKKGPSSVRWNWHCFKGNVGKTSERQGGAHMGFSEHTDTILNWQELPGKKISAAGYSCCHTHPVNKPTHRCCAGYSSKKQQEHLPDFTRNSKHVLQTEVKTMESCDFVVLGPSWPCKSMKVERKHKHIIMTLDAYKRILLKQGRIPLFLRYLWVPFFHWNKVTLTPSLLLENLVNPPPHPCITGVGGGIIRWFDFSNTLKKEEVFKHDEILHLKVCVWGGGGGGGLNMNPMNLLCMIHPSTLFLNKVYSTRDVLPWLFLRKRGGYFQQWKAQQSMTHLLYGWQSLALSVDSLQRL